MTSDVSADGERLFDEALEPELLRHGRYRQQASVGRQMLRRKVERRRSPDFIGLHRGVDPPWLSGRIVEIDRAPGRTFWYVVREDNARSIQAGEKAGFVRIGTGVRTTRLEILALGAFKMVATS